jgi:hypothetical protein
MKQGDVEISALEWVYAAETDFDRVYINAIKTRAY